MNGREWWFELNSGDINNKKTPSNKWWGI